MVRTIEQSSCMSFGKGLRTSKIEDLNTLSYIRNDRLCQGLSVKSDT